MRSGVGIATYVGSLALFIGLFFVLLFPDVRFQMKYSSTTCTNVTRSVMPTSCCTKTCPTECKCCSTSLNPTCSIAEAAKQNGECCDTNCGSGTCLQTCALSCSSCKNVIITVHTDVDSVMRVGQYSRFCPSSDSCTTPIDSFVGSARISCFIRKSAAQNPSTLRICRYPEDGCDVALGKILVPWKVVLVILPGLVVLAFSVLYSYRVFRSGFHARSPLLVTLIVWIGIGIPVLIFLPLSITDYVSSGFAKALVSLSCLACAASVPIVFHILIRSGSATVLLVVWFSLPISVFVPLLAFNELSDINRTFFLVLTFYPPAALIVGSLVVYLYNFRVEKKRRASKFSALISYDGERGNDELEVEKSSVSTLLLPSNEDARRQDNFSFWDWLLLLAARESHNKLIEQTKLQTMPSSWTDAILSLKFRLYFLAGLNFVIGSCLFLVMYDPTRHLGWVVGSMFAYLTTSALCTYAAYHLQTRFFMINTLLNFVVGAPFDIAGMILSGIFLSQCGPVQTIQCSSVTNSCSWLYSFCNGYRANGPFAILAIILACLSITWRALFIFVSWKKARFLSDDGVVGHFDDDEEEGGLDASDVQEPVCAVLRLDPGDSFEFFGENLSDPFVQGFTVEAWVSVEPAHDSNPVAHIGEGDEFLSSSNIFSINLFSDLENMSDLVHLSVDSSGTVVASVRYERSSTAVLSLSGGFSTSIDEWHHVSFSVSKKGLYLFLDGHLGAHRTFSDEMLPLVVVPGNHLYSFRISYHCPLLCCRSILLGFPRIWSKALSIHSDPQIFLSALYPHHVSSMDGLLAIVDLDHASRIESCSSLIVPSRDGDTRFSSRYAVLVSSPLELPALFAEYKTSIPSFLSSRFHQLDTLLVPPPLTPDEIRVRASAVSVSVRIETSRMRLFSFYGVECVCLMVLPEDELHVPIEVFNPLKSALIDERPWTPPLEAKVESLTPNRSHLVWITIKNRRGHAPSIGPFKLQTSTFSRSHEISGSSRETVSQSGSGTPAILPSRGKAPAKPPPSYADIQRMLAAKSGQSQSQNLTTPNPSSDSLFKNP